eukprot:6486054-Amphidinium_carterae.1
MQQVEAESAHLRIVGLGALPQLIQVLQTPAMEKSLPSLVETKGIGKPTTFFGKEDDSLGKLRALLLACMVRRANSPCMG